MRRTVTKPQLLDFVKQVRKCLWVAAWTRQVITPSSQIFSNWFFMTKICALDAGRQSTRVTEVSGALDEGLIKGGTIAPLTQNFDIPVVPLVLIFLVSLLCLSVLLLFFLTNYLSCHRLKGTLKHLAKTVLTGNLLLQIGYNVLLIMRNYVMMSILHWLCADPAKLIIKASLSAPT